MRVRGLRTDGRTDFGSCDDFHFSGLIESVSRAIAALIEWAYLTDLSAGAELTYLPFTACREICSRRCRSEGKESPKKNGMDAPIEFAAAPLLKEAREDRRQISIGGSGARKTCFAIHANGLGMPPSLDNQADALNTKPPVQTDARFAFSHRHLVFVSDVGLAAGWGVALNLSRHERTDGRHIPRMRATLSSSSSQFPNLSSTKMTPDRRARRRRIGLSGSGRPLIPIMQSQACDDRLPPRSADHATALTDADRMMAAGISLSPSLRGGRAAGGRGRRD